MKKLNQKGFTLIEVLLIVVILGIIAAIAIPRLMASREESRAQQAAYNLRNIISLQNDYNPMNGKYANLKELNFVATGDESIIYDVTITDDTGGSYKATAKLPSGTIFYITNGDNTIRQE